MRINANPMGLKKDNPCQGRSWPYTDGTNNSNLHVKNCTNHRPQHKTFIIIIVYRNNIETKAAQCGWPHLINILFETIVTDSGVCIWRAPVHLEPCQKWTQWGLLFPELLCCHENYSGYRQAIVLWCLWCHIVTMVIILTTIFKIDFQQTFFSS